MQTSPIRLRRFAAALLGLTAAAAAGAETRPNIVFQFSDDQRHDTLGSAGIRFYRRRRSTASRRAFQPRPCAG